MHQLTRDQNHSTCIDIDVDLIVLDQEGNASRVDRYLSLISFAIGFVHWLCYGIVALGDHIVLQGFYSSWSCDIINRRISWEISKEAEVYPK